MYVFTHTNSLHIRTFVHLINEAAGCTANTAHLKKKKVIWFFLLPSNEPQEQKLAELEKQNKMPTAVPDMCFKVPPISHCLWEGPEDHSNGGELEGGLEHGAGRALGLTRGTGTWFRSPPASVGVSQVGSPAEEQSHSHPGGAVGARRAQLWGPLPHPAAPDG